LLLLDQIVSVEKCSLAESLAIENVFFACFHTETHPSEDPCHFEPTLGLNLLLN